MTRRVRIVTEDRTAARTGLKRGVVVDVLEIDGDARLWVRCPEISRKTERGFEMLSDGYAVLEPREYEEI